MEAFNTGGFRFGNQVRHQRNVHQRKRLFGHHGTGWKHACAKARCNDEGILHLSHASSTG